MGRYTLYKYISRLMAVLMVLALVAGAVPAALAEGESGTLGDNLSWSLSGGMLTITGSCEMADIAETERAPWHELRNEIYQVVLPEGLTSIGNMAFYECEKLQSVVIPSSVTRIGRFAFAYCKKLEILNLGSGVTAIEECAFTDCYRLASLQLPGSLKTIGKKAFYRCESIPVVTVPASVTSLGISTFGYCKSLVSADIQAQITEIPTLLFYGCERMTSVKLPDSIKTVGYHTFRDCSQLNTVYYNGTTQTPEKIQQTIGLDVPEFVQAGNVTSGKPDDTVTSGAILGNEDGTITWENTVIDKGVQSVVSTNTLNQTKDGATSGNGKVEITVTVEGEDGWDEATDALKKALQDSDQAIAQNGGTVAITVYTKDTETVSQDFVNTIGGRDVTLTIVTQEGATWQLHGTDLDTENDAKTYDLSYEVSTGSAELCEELGTDRCYVLRFLEPAEINAEVMIRVAPELYMQNATLLQRGKELQRIQTTVVDAEGYAHFYLASVSEKTEYYIAMNLPDAQQEAIIPEAVQSAYGNLEYVEPIKYEITGRKSSWGMTFQQVSGIMIAVMVSVVVIVGIVMFVLNKRKLRRGYIPDIE